MRNVESSTSASEAAALCDVTATTRKPATKRMSQGATQHKRGKTDGEENNTIPNAPSGCLLQALNDADDAFSPKRMRQRATHTEKRRNKQRITDQNVAKPLLTANFANSRSFAPSGCLLQALTKPSRRTPACSCLLLTAGRREKCRVVDLSIRSGRSF